MCEPTGIAAVVNWATPPCSVADPYTFPLTTNCTVSPSSGGPAIDVMVAVNVTGCPSTEGFADEVNGPIILGTNRKPYFLVVIAITPKSFTCIEYGCTVGPSPVRTVKSCIPPDGVHKNPCRRPSPEVVREVPTIHPRLLMLRAELCPPPKSPRSLIPPVCVQEKAWLYPLATGDRPTTVPASLTAYARVPAGPRFWRPPAGVQTKPSVLRLPLGK